MMSTSHERAAEPCAASRECGTAFASLFQSWRPAGRVAELLSLDRFPLMDLSHIKSYEGLVEYLRGFTNANGEAVPYDSGGVAHLLGALLDNIHAHGGESDFEEFQDRFTPEQIATLRRIAAHVRT